MTELAEAAQEVQAEAPKAPKQVGRILQLSIKVPEGEDLGQLVAKASEIGDVASLSVHPDFGYNDPFGY